MNEIICFYVQISSLQQINHIQNAVKDKSKIGNPFQVLNKVLDT